MRPGDLDSLLARNIEGFEAKGVGISGSPVACDERCGGDHECPVGEWKEEAQRWECQEGGDVRSKDEQDTDQPEELGSVQGSRRVQLVLYSEVLEIE